jgi:HIV Tat-specific factor 1
MALRNPDDNPAPTAATSSLEHPTGGFPRDPSEFDSDPRISFSKLDNKFILETEDGQEFEFDSALKRWVPVVGISFCATPFFACAVVVSGFSPRCNVG